MEETAEARSRLEAIKQIRNFCVIALIIFSGVYSKLLIIAAALLGFAVAVFKDLPYTIEFLFFLLPMSVVFKMNPDATSFYSYILLLAVVKEVFVKTEFSGTIAGILLMVAYLLFGGSLANFGRCRDILTCLLTCYLVMTGRVQLDFERLVVIFSVGVLISALVSLLSQNTPIFMGLASRIRLTDVQGEEVSRFRGLYGNSNYYTLDITLLCACYMSLYCGKKSLTKEQWVMLLLLLVVGILSGSFSFLITSSLTLLAGLLYLTRQNITLMIRTVVIFAIVLGIVFLLMGDSTKTLITYRVESQMTNTDDLSKMTSGRSELQAAYLEHFRENTGSLLLGEGLGAPHIGSGGRGPHNTFIDIVYYFGIVGGAVYIGTLVSFMRVKVRFTTAKMHQWIPLASLLVRLMAISLLLLNNITLYYLLIWLSLTHNTEERLSDGVAPGPAY